MEGGIADTRYLDRHDHVQVRVWFYCSSFAPPDDTVTLTCPECHLEFEMPRWQYEIDMEEEGEGWEPVCPSCSGIEDLY